jgi:hypothetical protein
MRLVSACLLVLLSLSVGVLAGPAVAKDKRHAPPGNSGVDEYTEVVPDGGGARPPSRRGRGRVLGSQQRQKLAAQGSQGRKAARLAELTGDPASNKRASGGSKSQAAELADAESKSGDSGLVAAIKRVAAGAAFPVLLLVVLGGGLLLAVLRRRSRAT